MLDLNFILSNPDKVKQACRHKNLDSGIVDQVIKLAQEKKQLQRQVEDLRAQKNRLNKDQRDQARQIKLKLKEVEPKLRQTTQQLNDKLAFIPNIPADDVPVGTDESGNVVIYEKGQKPAFSFTPKTHDELAQRLDIIDTKRGAKVSGFRGYFLKNEGALMHLGVLWYAFQKLVAKGFTPVIAPAIVKRFVLFGAGQFPWGERETYVLNDKDAYLAGTAEQPMMAYFSGETLNEKDLPIKFVAFSPCYRREAGSYGKDTKGVYRVHEFMKVEQLVIDAADKDKANQWIEELKNNSEEILQDLNLPYRVLRMCTGDMGEPHHKKYDIETWMPGRGKYGETMSDSIMTDFQARRLKIYYQTKSGDRRLAYSYNNTAIASPRILVAILENYQQKDGSVKVPDVLRSFVGVDIIKPKDD